MKKQAVFTTIIQECVVKSQKWKIFYNNRITGSLIKR